MPQRGQPAITQSHGLSRKNFLLRFEVTLTFEDGRVIRISRISRNPRISRFIQVRPVTTIPAATITGDSMS
jgi:hypothetical protein